HKTKLPIGYGMGASGAGALSLALALNSALGTKLSRKLCEKTARRAEIECGTGLGDTTAQMNAGVFYGKKPYPSKTAVRIKTKKRHVALGFFAPIKTKNIIRSAEWKGKINRSGTWCMGHIEKNRNVDALMHCARVFAVETGLATRRVRAVMNEIPEAGQAMLGETVFMLTNSPASARAALKKHTHRVIVSRIAKKGAHVL
ncbi:hypothetical protein KKH30_00615, partial [Candidatus Micrarchaeota archaeon]|nr:hypothetical protein [Candidatus Micrarchaeota archaeon]MBU1939245.1 hypothetical protein [Candidatus Micrarchaeota archaeon]